MLNIFYEVHLTFPGKYTSGDSVYFLWNVSIDMVSWYCLWWHVRFFAERRDLTDLDLQKVPKVRHKGSTTLALKRVLDIKLLYVVMGQRLSDSFIFWRSRVGASMGILSIEITDIHGVKILILGLICVTFSQINFDIKNIRINRKTESPLHGGGPSVV